MYSCANITSGAGLEVWMASTPATIHPFARQSHDEPGLVELYSQNQQWIAEAQAAQSAADIERFIEV
jgi:hypothetical protein